MKEKLIICPYAEKTIQNVVLLLDRLDKVLTIHKGLFGSETISRKQLSQIVAVLDTSMNRIKDIISTITPDCYIISEQMEMQLNLQKIIESARRLILEEPSHNNVRNVREQLKGLQNKVLASTIEHEKNQSYSLQTSCKTKNLFPVYINSHRLLDFCAIYEDGYEDFREVYTETVTDRTKNGEVKLGIKTGIFELTTALNGRSDKKDSNQSHSHRIQTLASMLNTLLKNLDAENVEVFTQYFSELVFCQLQETITIEAPELIILRGKVSIPKYDHIFERMKLAIKTFFTKKTPHVRLSTSFKKFLYGIPINIEFGDVQIISTLHYEYFYQTDWNRIAGNFLNCLCKVVSVDKKNSHMTMQVEIIALYN